jgi:hypothetical protein
MFLTAEDAEEALTKEPSLFLRRGGRRVGQFLLLQNLKFREAFPFLNFKI